jgi:hypothetical protein
VPVQADSGGRVSELTLLILRLGFLIALWVFVFFVVYAVRSDLFGPRVRRLPTAPSGSQATSSSNAANAFLTSATPRIPAAETDIITSLATSTPGSDSPLRLVIISGDKTGQSLALTEDSVTIGRSSDSSVVIKDDYTSTHHARLEIRGGTWVLRDLDSTNGTLLGGVKVTSPTPVPLNTPITIGSTSFEVRR